MLFALAGVAACGGGTGAPPAAPVAATGEADSPALTPAAPAPAPQEAAIPLPVPTELIGKSREDVYGLLGDPVFVRRDPPAEFWRYRHPGCVMELYFYEKSGVPRLDHYETRLIENRAVSDAHCLQALMIRAAKR